MKINTLHIKNFKNLKDVSFDFSNQRIILFLGETGNGKSSIFDALAYVLTDSLEEKLIEYVRWGQKEFEIDCTFTHLNHKYDMSIVGGKTTKKKLIIDDNEEFLNSEASKKLSEIVDPVLTKYSAISEQGKSTSLLTDSPANRIKKLREILKINKTVEAGDAIKEDVRLEKEKLDKLQSEIKVLEGLKFIYMDLPILNDVSKLENEFALLQEKKKQYDIDMIWWNQYNKELEKYNDAQNKINEIQSKIALMEGDKRLVRLKPDLDFDLELHENVIKELNDISIKEIKYNQTVKDYNKYLDDRLYYETQIDELSAKKFDIKLVRIAPCSYTDEHISEMKFNLNSFIISKSELNNKLKLIEQGKCPITEHECTQIVSLNKDDIINEINMITEKVNILIDEIDKADKDKKRFELETKEQDKLRNEKQSLQDKIDMIQKQLDNLTVIDRPETINFSDKINELKKLKLKLDSDKNEVEKIKEYNQAQNLKLNSLETQIKSYMEQILTLLSVVVPSEIIQPEFDIKYYDEIKLNIDLYKSKKEEYDRVVKFNSELKQNEDSTKDKINLLTDQVQTIRSNIRVLEEARNIIEKKFSSYLIEKGTLFIKEKMNQFFQRSYGRYQISLGQDKNSIDFFYSDGVHKETPCGIASGFERQIISVACRVALSQIQNLGILMLDEADSESSSVRSEMLYKTLLNEKFNQVFAITHKDNTQEFLSNTPNAGVYEIKLGELLN